MCILEEFFDRFTIAEHGLTHIQCMARIRVTRFSRARSARSKSWSMSVACRHDAGQAVPDASLLHALGPSALPCAHSVTAHDDMASRCTDALQGCNIFILTRSGLAREYRGLPYRAGA